MPVGFLFALRRKRQLWRIIFLRFAYQESESHPLHLRPAYRSRAVNRARTPGGTGASANCHAPNACRQRRRRAGANAERERGPRSGRLPCPAYHPPATPSAGSVTLGQAARLFCGFAWNKHALAAVRRECFTVCPVGQALHSRPLRSAPAGEGRETKGGASHSQAAHYDPVPQRHPRPVRPGPLENL